MRDRRRRRGDDEFERGRVVGIQRTPDAIGACRPGEQRPAFALAAVGSSAIDVDLRALDRRLVGVAPATPVTRPSSTTSASGSIAIREGGCADDERERFPRKRAD